ncbi:hypothetical protein [Baekduia sp. Peel2402]|uniref:hypothetical protein n=1 Tax=Baekduia sp. Peel2402 TaxID=3458296 RepID=UPI00403EAAAF
MSELPLIDEHAMVVDASPAATWDAVDAVVRGSFASRRTERFARALGCEPATRSGDALVAGATLPGFAIVRAEPDAALVLEGRHRFARYRLTFTLASLDDGARCRVTAITHAAFPGARGRVYRALVIGTRAHVLVTRRLLTAIRRRATR